MKNSDLRQAIKNLPFQAKEVEWVGLRRVREITTDRVARDGKPLYNETEDSHGVMVEVLCNGQFGYAATSKTDPESLNAAIKAARVQSEQVKGKQVFHFTDSVRPKITTRYNSPVVKPIDSVGAGELNELLVKITQKLKSMPKAVRSDAVVRTVQCEMEFVSTNGSDAEQTFSNISFDFDVTAQDGSVIQKRSDCGMRGRSYQGGWELILNDDIWRRVDRVGKDVMDLLVADECPTETTSLVLMPDQMMLQIHESIGHPLELDRILGDERNYAGWSFVQLEDFGKLQYGSPIMNVTFDPTVEREFASYAFDDNGTQAKREFLIQNGKLLRALGGIESQTRTQMKIPGVANARSSSWNRPPIDRMANINLEPGDSSFDDIIGSIESGVIMESNRSWSIDDFRNKFQFGCEYARKIENGKITKVLKNPNYRGITVPFWKSLKKVGNASTLEVYGTPYCGKGEPNQAIRVGHASPVCLFENIEVFGGA
jgi:predicted Zn-dependent protease